MERKVVKTSCPRDCYSGCTMNVYVEDGKVVKVEGGEGNRATGGTTCIKGMALKDYVYSPNRLKYPMLRTGARGEGKFERISWDTAADRICSELKKVKERSGPLGLYAFMSGGCKGLLSSYYEGFFRQYGGYSRKKGNLCCSAGTEAVKLTYGEVMHNVPWDLENAGLVIIWGKNSANTNVHELMHINNAKARGAKVITIDPIRTATADKADIHISPRPGTDLALALCIMNSLIKRESVNYEFIEKYTHGYEALKKHVEGYTMEYASNICGIQESEILTIIEMLETCKPMTLVCGVGIQRYKNGGQTVRAISMIPALTGDVGIKGGGFRFMNYQWPSLNWPFLPEGDYEIRNDYPAALLAEAINGFKDPEINMLWVERANPMVTHPDTSSLKKAFDKLECIVVVDQFMTDTAKYADIILPAQSFLEYNDMFTGDSSYLYYVQRAIEPYYESRNEAEIYRLLGEKMGFNMQYLPEFNEEALGEVLRLSGINADINRLKEGPYNEGYMEIAFKDRRFNTPSGKIELYSKAVVEKWNESPIPEFRSDSPAGKGNEYPLRFLSTHPKERLHSQFADVDKLNTGRPLLYINREDALRRNINDGDELVIFNEKGEIHAFANITDRIKSGVVNVYEGLSEHTGASVNMLTSQDFSDIGWGATYYECFVEIKKN